MKPDHTRLVATVERLLEQDSKTRAETLRAVEASEQWDDLTEAVRHLAMQDVDRAIRAAGVIVTTIDLGVVPAPRALPILRARARALAYKGEFDAALHVCHEAVRRAERCEDGIEIGRAQLASMHALGELGRLDEALVAGQAARRQFLALDDVAMAARADINLGVVHQRRDDPDAALACFDRARLSLANDPMMMGHLENNRGEAFFGLHRFEDAEHAYRAAFDAFDAAGAELTAGIARSNLAELASRQGRLDQAMHGFESARRRLEAAGSPAHVARLLAESADAKAALGLPREALDDYTTALERLEASRLPLEAARARAGMGRVLVRLNRTAEAETAFAAAATAFDELGHTTARSRIEIARAELAMSRDDPALARRRAHVALAALSDRPADVAQTRHLLARCALADGDLELAEAEILAALALVRPLGALPFEADLFVTRAAIRAAQGRVDDAIVDLEDAVARIERLRGALQADRLRIAYLRDRLVAYDRLLSMLLERAGPGDCARAFEVAEQARARTLLTRLASLTVEDRSGGDDYLDREIALVQADLNVLYSRLADDVLESDDPARLDTWRAAVREREEHMDRLETRAQSAFGVATLFAPSSSLQDVMTTLQQDETLLQYHLVDDGLHVFVVTAARVTFVKLDVSTTRLRSSLRRLRFLMSHLARPDVQRTDARREDLQAELESLHASLLAPVMKAIGTPRRLIVVPHGLLHLVPFAALHDGDRYLIEASEVLIAPSASILVRLRRRDAVDRGSAVVVAVPDADAPAIADEAARVGAVLDAPALIGEDATVERTLAALRDAGMAHLACHGRFLPDAPRASGLRLADRWLTVRDVYRQRIGAQLVVLSGCETAVPHVATGDELSGLLHGLLAAGAGAVVASLWRVNDARTVAFMESFHEHRKTMDTGAALRAAQRTLIDAGEGPAIWSAFLSVGAR